MLPLFGAISDRTNSRMGKRTPFVVFGTVAACARTILLPVGNAMHSLPTFMAGLFLALIAMADVSSPPVALMPTVTPYLLRSKANAVINLMGAAGGILALLAISILVPAVDHPDYIPIFAFVIVLMLLCLFCSCWTVDEPKLARRCRRKRRKKTGKTAGKLDRAQRRSLILILCSVFLWFMGYNAVTTWFSTYGEVMWGFGGGSFAYTLMIAQAAAIVSRFPPDRREQDRPQRRC